MNEALEREIAELTALTSPREPKETGGRHQSAPDQSAPDQALRESWLQLADLLEAASAETPPRSNERLASSNVQLASSNVQLAEPGSWQKNKPLVARRQSPAFSKGRVFNSTNRSQTESYWAVWAVAGSLLLMFFAVGARLPAVRQNPLASIAERERPSRQNSVAADSIKIVEAPQSKQGEGGTPKAATAKAVVSETSANDDASLAWDSGLDDAIASAEIAVWSFESNARPAEQAVRWVDTQIQQLEQDFQDNSL